MFVPESTLNFKNARTVLQQGEAALRAGQREFDLGVITTLDSAAVAVILSWCKTAQQLDITLRLLNLSENLQNLARLYGVEALLLERAR